MINPDSANFRANLESVECEHENLDEAPVQTGECACGCRDYKFCPDCEESVEIEVER